MAIRQEIERKRKEMELCVKKEGILSAKAIAKSQELDQLIYIFQKDHIKLENTRR